MILKTYLNKNLYGKYFLAVEAPDDEEVTEDTPKPKRNVKVISVKPSNRGTDFTQVGNPPITPDSTEVNDELDFDDQDYGSEPETETLDNTDDTSSDTNQEEVEPTQEPEETNQPVENEGETDNAEVDEQPTEDQPDTGDNDTTDFTADSEETGEDGPDIGGDDDFTDGAGDDTTDTEDPETVSTTDGNKPSPPGVEFDSTRKYNLYKEYMSLYNACDNYISKLENILLNDYSENQIIRISVNSLREIKDILSDYMTIRFQLNTYVQSLLFYQKMVVAIQLVFNLLKSIRSKKTK